jgi:DNA-binding response OmpR family regulator
MKGLMVDDDKLMSEAIAHVLEAEGYEVGWGNERV